MTILVFNAGSTSLKFGLFTEDSDEPQLSGSVRWSKQERQEARVQIAARGQNTVTASAAVSDNRGATGVALEAVRPLGRVEAIGHRVVHGGTEFSDATVIDPKVKAAIQRLGKLAPLHNPPASEVIQAVTERLPGVPQVAVFDTAFFARLPERAYLYPVPYEWAQRWGVRRIGFHGINHAWCARRAAQLLSRDAAQLRLVTCHLGGGCSATAVRGGVPVATTMGFTPMEGLMMSTRSGSIDPGVLLYLLRERLMTVEELDRVLNHESGLLGISGHSAVVTELERASRAGQPRARLALEMFADRVRAAIGALAVQMSGLDALIFTAGMSEHSPALRTMVCEGLECLGIKLDAARNAAGQPDAEVASDDSTGRVLVIQSREEVMIARETQRVLAKDRPNGTRL